MFCVWFFIKKKGQELSKFLLCLTVMTIIMSCYFGIREPISLFIIIPFNILSAYFFLWIMSKSENNSRLSNSEKNKVAIFTSAGGLCASLAIGLITLSWVNSGYNTAIFGDRYTKREEVEQVREKVRNEENRDYNSISLAQAAVKRKLKDSKSAEFSSERLNKSSGTLVVCGYVNSKNSFGGFSGKQKYVSNGSSDGTFIEEEVENFISVWNKFCN